MFKKFFFSLAVAMGLAIGVGFVPGNEVSQAQAYYYPYGYSSQRYYQPSYYYVRPSYSNYYYQPYVRPYYPRYYQNYYPNYSYRYYY